MKMRTLLLPALLLALSVPNTSYADHHPQRQSARSPILVVEAKNSDGTQLLLAVYNDGGSSLSRKDEDAPEGELCSATASAASLKTLEDALLAAGARHLSSQAPVEGASQKTISFFPSEDNSSHTEGNTFVYFLRQGPYLAVGTAITNFINDVFAGCV